MSNKKLAAIIAFIIILVAFFIVKISVISDGDSERYHSLIMSSEASPEQKVYHVGSQHRHACARNFCEYRAYFYTLTLFDEGGESDCRIDQVEDECSDGETGNGSRFFGGDVSMQRQVWVKGGCARHIPG